ncbi:MAG: hypothetical protein AAF611_19440 [Bacteroidota bacterium]
MKTNFTYLTILFLLLSISACKKTEKPVPLPSTALCAKDAQTMEENYITLKGFDSIPDYDNRVISFTHKQMMESLNYLQSEANKRDIEDEKLGFRVYLGAKFIDEFKEVDSIKGDMRHIKDVPGTYYTTVFFVATRKGTSDDPSDYENVYEIPALNYGGSRRPPKRYISNVPCPVQNNTP